MRLKSYLSLLIAAFLLSACQIQEVNSGGGDEDSSAVYKNVTAANLPNLNEISRDAKAADIDADGDLDLIIAVEGDANRILINNGNAFFRDETVRRLPASAFNGRDVAIADFNLDDRLDIFFANANPPLDGIYFNTGNGFFALAANRIPNQLRSNAALAYDFNRDGSAGILLGNIGQNLIFINDGSGFFSNQTGTRLPYITVSDVTFDLELADIDNDGDRDLLTANKRFSRLYLNAGQGFYVNRTEDYLPIFSGKIETRDIELADINGDGDLDIYFANALPFQNGANAPDRLLVNSGNGAFINATDSQLPFVGTNTLDAEFLDIDLDGDADILAGVLSGGLHVLINDGTGNFSNAAVKYFPPNIAPRVIDFEIADFNGDDLLDVYIATFSGPNMLLLRNITS